MAKRRKLVQYGKRARRSLHFDASDDIDMFFPNSKDVDQSQNPPPLPPSKILSQKAATMPAEPEEGQITTLIEFCPGMSRSEAIRYVKVC